MRTIPLTRGYFTTVDDSVYERLAQFKWHARVKYEGRHVSAARWSRGKLVLMHREVAAAPSGVVVDHIDGDALNNCQANLRICSPSENAMNRRPHKMRSDAATRHSRFKGVAWDAQRGKWRVRLRVAGRTVYGGRHDSEVAAAEEYNRLARQHHGEFARPNVLFHGEPDQMRRLRMAHRWSRR